MEGGQFKLHRSLFVQSKNSNIADYYDFNPKPIGKGAYGTVYKAKLKAKENTWRAVKRIQKKSIRNPKQFSNEVEIMKSLDHPNIVKIYETFEDESSVYLVSDLCEGGQLFDRLDAMGSFSEADARIIFKQIAEAINYCHVQKICHRDLKPENFILVNKNSLSLKVIDFGLSVKWQKNMREQLLARKETKLVGTSYYIAPEILQGSYDERCDIWSMGVILYILVTACPPFDGQNDKEIIESVRKRYYTLDIPAMKHVSAPLKDLIKKILLSPNDRLTLKQIFEHPWMTTSNLNKEPLKLNFAKMSNFTKFSKLKTLAVTYIASQLSDKEIERLGDLFKQVDLDHDGYITVEELKYALEHQKEKASLQQLKQLMDYIDTDKNGKINFTEFVASCLDNSLIYKEENLKMVFQMLDKDGNGVVSAQELKEVISHAGQGIIGAKIIDQMIKACDRNGDGLIDYKEFLQNMSEM